MKQLLERAIGLVVQIRRDRALAEDTSRAADAVAVTQHYASLCGAGIKALTRASSKAALEKALQDVYTYSAYTLNLVEYVSPNVIAQAVQDGFSGKIHPGLKSGESKPAKPAPAKSKPSPTEKSARGGSGRRRLVS